MATGIKYMFAITWSSPSATKVNVGNQMASIFDAISREEMEAYTAKQTSQFAPIARQNIWTQEGVIHFAVAKLMTSVR